MYGGKLTTRRLIVLAALAVILVGTAYAANYMYEKASVKGVGYKNTEVILSTKEGFNGSKLVAKEAGSGNIIMEKTELEAEKQIGSGCDGGSGGSLEAVGWSGPSDPKFFHWPWNSVGDYGPWSPPIYWDYPISGELIPPGSIPI